MATFESNTQLERQLSSLFRAEAWDAHLPLGTWQSITPRMGEPDTSFVFRRLRDAFRLPRWRNPMNVKYVAPAATVVLALIAALIFVLLVNGDEDDKNPVPATTPTVPVQATEGPADTPEATRLVPSPTAMPTTGPEVTSTPNATSTPVRTEQATPTEEPALPTATPEPFGVSFLDLPGQIIRRAESTLWVTETLVGLKEVDESGAILRSITAPRGDINVSDFALVGEEVWTVSQDLDPSIRIKIFGLDGTVTRIEHRTTYGGVEYTGESVWFPTGQRVRRFLPDRSELPELVFDADVRQLLWDGNNAWISTGNSELLKLDPDGQIQERFSIPFTATVLAFDGQAVWIGSGSSSTIYRIGSTDGEILTEFSTDSVPGNVAGLAFDGQKVWISYKNPAQTSGGVVTASIEGQLQETVVSQIPVGELTVGFDYVWGPTLIAPRHFVRMSTDRS